MSLVDLLDPSIPEPERREGFYQHHRGRRYKLGTALKALKALLERAGQINDDATLPFMVERIDLFGSVLRAKPDVGDLDLYVTLALREGWDYERGRAWCKACGEGRLGRTPYYSWQDAALRRLKARNPVVKFSADDPAKHGFPFRTVFERRRGLSRP